MKEIAKTKKVLESYSKGGMKLVIEYLSTPDLEFKEGTWVYKINNLMKSKLLISLEAEINSILYKFNLNDNKAEQQRGEDIELYS